MCKDKDGKPIASNTILRTVTVNSTEAQILGPSPKRIAVIFSSPVGGRVSINPGGKAVLDNGLTLFQGFPPTGFSSLEYRCLPHMPWRAIANVDGVTLNIIEVIEA